MIVSTLNMQYTMCLPAEVQTNSEENLHPEGWYKTRGLTFVILKEGS